MDSIRDLDIVKLMSEGLTQHLNSHEDYSSCEKEGVAWALGLLAKALGQALTAFDQSLFDEHDPLFTSKGFETRRFIALCGQVIYKRRRYVYHDGTSTCLADVLLDIPADIRITPFVTQFAANIALDTSYAKTAHCLSLLSGESFSAPTIAAAVKDTARIIDRHAQGQPILPQDKKISEELYAEADGIHCYLQRRKAAKLADAKAGYKRTSRMHEVRVIAVYEGKELHASGAKTCINPSYHATTETPEIIWERVRSYIESRYDTTHTTRSYLGVDGAQWCARGAEYLPGLTEISYDHYHMAHFITATCGIKIGTKIAKILKAHGITATLSALDEQASHITDTKVVKKYRRLIRFMVKHARSIERGLKANLGTIEGTNAHVVGARCKVWGGGWSLAGLNSMVTCRASALSGNPLPLKSRINPADLVRLIMENKRTVALQAETSALAAQELVLAAFTPLGNHTANPKKSAHGLYSHQVHVTDPGVASAIQGYGSGLH